MLVNINDVMNKSSAQLIACDDTPLLGKVMLLLYRRHWPSILILISPSDDSILTSLLDLESAAPLVKTANSRAV